MPNLKISELTAGNPAVTGDQIPINRGGTNYSVTVESVAALSAGPTFGTASPSWWASGDGSVYPFGNGLGDFSTGNANQIKFWMIRIPYTISVSKLCTFINQLVNPSVCGYAVYNATGTTKILSWDNIATSTSGNKTTTITPVTIQPGVYISACASSVSGRPTTQGGYATEGSNEPVEPWNNNGVIRSGTAANAMAAGVMPASLGVLSTSNAISNVLPCIIMQP